MSENKRQIRNSRFRSHVFTCKQRANFRSVNPHHPTLVMRGSQGRAVLAPFQNCPVFPGHVPTVFHICSLFRISAYRPVPRIPLFPSMCQEEVGLASRNKVLKVVLIHVVSVPTLFNNKFILIQLAPTGYVTVVVSGSSLNSEELKRLNNWKVRHIGDEFDIFFIPVISKSAVNISKQRLNAITVRMRTTISPRQVSGNHRQLFRPPSASSARHRHYCQGELFQTIQIISRNY